MKSFPSLDCKSSEDRAKSPASVNLQQVPGNMSAPRANSLRSE